MNPSDRSIKCYIASLTNPEIDPFLEARQFCHGLVMFAMPDYGIIFRCRVEAAPIDLEFAAFFSLLKFIKTQLAKEKITDILVHSSNPEFVFSFTPQSKHLAKGSERERLLKEYASNLGIQIRFVEPHKNQAMLSPADCPSLPAHRAPTLKPDPMEHQKKSFKPFQRGIKL